MFVKDKNCKKMFANLKECIKFASAKKHWPMV